MNTPQPRPASETRFSLAELERFAANLRDLERRAVRERKPVLAKQANHFEKLAARRRLREQG